MSDIVRIYVAGSSNERERVRLWVDKLKLYVGVIEVMSTWIDVIDGEQHGQPNPRDASHRDRKRWALKNLEEIANSDVIWYLVPDKATGGGYFESGFAYDQIKMIFSGDTKQSVFCALGEEFATDEEAYHFILAEMGVGTAKAFNAS